MSEPLPRQEPDVERSLPFFAILLTARWVNEFIEMSSEVSDWKLLAKSVH